jgi:hypothetical protein
MAEKGLDLRRPHGHRVALSLIQDEPANPRHVGLLRPEAVMPPPEGLPNLIEEPRLAGHLVRRYKPILGVTDLCLTICHCR